MTVVGTIEDASGNVYSGVSSWNFTTMVAPDTTPPSLVAFIPADNAVNVDPAIEINAVFDENITNTGQIFLIQNTAPGAGPVNGMEGISDDTLWFRPNNDLVEGDTYTATILGPVEDLSGNEYTGQTSWTFTVAAAVDNTAPSLVSLTPADNAVDVNISTVNHYGT